VRRLFVTGRSEGSLRRRSAGAVLALFSTSCGSLSGLDEFRILPCPHGFVELGGACQVRCGPGEAPTADGACERVGVGDCGDDFEPDGEGGCTPTGATAGCKNGEVSFLGQTGCVPAPCGDIGLGVKDGVAYGTALDDGWPAVWIGGDGTDRPSYPSLAEALAANPKGPLWIGVRKGLFETSITIDRPVYLLGCTTKVEFHSSTGAPVFRFVAGSERSHVEGVTVTGGQGVVAEGVTNFSLANVVVQDTTGPGLSLSACTGTLVSRVLVERAAGDGIAVVGSTDVTIELSNVRDGLPRADGMGGAGIRVRPSLTYPAQAPFVIASPSQVEVGGTVVERVRGSGIVAEGSELAVHRSVVRDVAPDAWGVGRGIEAVTDPIAGHPSALTVRQTVVERAHDAGIRADGATAVVEDTTVRDIGTDDTTPSAGESFVDAEQCLGVGIRARWNLVRKIPDTPDIVVRRSLLSGVREAALTAEGVQVEVERSLFRGVRGTCDGRGGDGLAVYSTPDLPAAASVDQMRVEGAARSAVASFGAEVGIARSWLESAGDMVVAEVGGGRVIARGSACEGTSGAKACSPKKVSHTPALLGWNGCVADAEHACVPWCFGKFSPDAVGGDTAVAGVSLWPRNDDGTATQVTDGDGCLTYLAPRHRRVPWVSQGGDCTASVTSGACPPSVVLTQAGDGDIASDFEHIGTVGASYWYQSVWYKPDPLDSIAEVVFLCDVTSETAKPWRYCGRYTGLAGARVTIDGADPTHYTTEGGVIAGPDAGTSTAATVIFFNTPAGRHVLHVEPMPQADFKQLDCSLDWPAGSGWQWGWRKIDPTNFEVIVTAGIVNLGARLWCTRK
jgi:hypothetical protein